MATGAAGPILMVAVVSAVWVAGCGESTDDGASGGPSADSPPAAGPSVDLAEPSGDLFESGGAPDAERLLPDLDAYATDDSAEPGELMASLDHGEVPYEEVRRRLVLDEEGFQIGQVTVVTFQPGAEGPAAFVDHHYGEAPSVPARVAGVEMLRVEREPHPALVWPGPTFVVAFERGAEVADEWTEELARSTVEAIRAERR